MIVKGSEEGQMVDRTLFELWLFQIFDLHYVFLSEQIRFFVGSIAEEDEQEFVFSQSMKDRIAHFQLLKDKVLIELELYELV